MKKYVGKFKESITTGRLCLILKLRVKSQSFSFKSHSTAV